MYATGKNSYNCQEDSEIPAADSYIYFQTYIVNRQEEAVKITLKGFKHTEETKQKMSDARKGKIPWNKGKTGIYSDEIIATLSEKSRGNTHRRGKKHTDSAKNKMAIAHVGRISPLKGKKTGRPAWNKGISMSEETKHKLSKMSTGRIHTEETKKKISAANSGRKLSDEHKKKLSDAKLGNIPWNKGKKGLQALENSPMWGKHHSEETKKKISIGNKGKAGLIGENSPTWKGGISFSPYCHKFNDKFKESIRDKFNRECFLCGISESSFMERQAQNGKQPQKLSVHHTDYNKDCLCDNIKCEFVPLCTSCHGKTNHNREHYEKIINDGLIKRGFL